MRFVNIPCSPFLLVSYAFLQIMKTDYGSHVPKLPDIVNKLTSEEMFVNVLIGKEIDIVPLLPCRWIKLVQLRHGTPLDNTNQLWFQRGQIITCPVKSGVKLLIHSQNVWEWINNFIPNLGINTFVRWHISLSVLLNNTVLNMIVRVCSFSVLWFYTLSEMTK